MHTDASKHAFIPKIQKKYSKSKKIKKTITFFINNFLTTHSSLLRNVIQLKQQ